MNEDQLPQIFEECDVKVGNVIQCFNVVSQTINVLIQNRQKFNYGEPSIAWNNSVKTNQKRKWSQTQQGDTALLKCRI